MIGPHTTLSIEAYARDRKREREAESERARLLRLAHPAARGKRFPWAWPALPSLRRALAGGSHPAAQLICCYADARCEAA